MVTASLKNYRISPRKFRIVADMVRGKSVIEAKDILSYALRQAKNPLNDLIDSAVANASHNHKLEKDRLFIKEIRVDKGYTLKRHMPVSRGSAHPIKKRTSHVSIILAPFEAAAKQAPVKAVATKTAPAKAKATRGKK